MCWPAACSGRCGLRDLCLARLAGGVFERKKKKRSNNGYQSPRATSILRTPWSPSILDMRIRYTFTLRTAGGLYCNRLRYTAAMFGSSVPISIIIIVDELHLPVSQYTSCYFIP
jgi:hypothetical protein